MVQANILEAKTELSSLLRLLETGEEDRIIIARRNKPVAQITLYEKTTPTKRIGVAQGITLYQEGWDDPSINEEIAELFGAQS